MPSRLRSQQVSLPIPPLLLSTPTGPFWNKRFVTGKSPPVPPIFARPGLMTPWLLGPTSRTPARLAWAIISATSCWGTPSAHTRIIPTPALRRLDRRFRSRSRGHEQDGGVRRMLIKSSGERIKNGRAVTILARAPRHHAGHDAGAVLAHEAGVGARLPAGDARHDDARGLIDENAQRAPPVLHPRLSALHRLDLKDDALGGFFERHLIAQILKAGACSRRSPAPLPRLRPRSGR